MVVHKGLEVSNGIGLFKLGKREFPGRLVARLHAFTAEGVRFLGRELRSSKPWDVAKNVLQIN